MFNYYEIPYIVFIQNELKIFILVIALQYDDFVNQKLRSHFILLPFILYLILFFMLYLYIRIQCYVESIFSK